MTTEFKRADDWIRGVKMDFNGVVLDIPPLPLGDLEDNKDKIDQLANGFADASAVLDIAYLAFKINYPDITRKDLGKLIHLGNMGLVIESIMGASGLRRKEIEELSRDESLGKL